MLKNSVRVLVLLVFVAAIGGCVFYLMQDWQKWQASVNSKISTTEAAAKPEPVPQAKPENIGSYKLDWVKVTDSAPWETRDSQGMIVYNNKIYLMGGLDANKYVIDMPNVAYENAPHFSDVWESEDGASWTMLTDKAPWGNRRSIQLVDFKGKMWLIGGWTPKNGCMNDIWTSEDGASWNLETAHANYPAREGHTVLVYDNKLWLFGGVKYEDRKLFNDVWNSEDGIHWNLVTENAGWSPRWDHSVATFNNKFWMVGGMAFNGQIYNDEWVSDDGANWTEANKNPPFAPRQGFFMTEYKGKLWIVGRLDGRLNGGTNDIWYSEDGIKWLKTEKDPEWFGREDFGALIFNGQLWVFGGMDKNWHWNNDIWHSVN